MRKQKDLFNELDVTKKLLTERTKYPFMEVVKNIKKRVSFFGIYKLCDELELTATKINFLKVELDRKSRLLLQHQNQIRVNYESIVNRIDPDKMFGEDPEE